MYCSHCGRQVLPQAKFCPGCGNTIVVVASAPPNLSTEPETPVRKQTPPPVPPVKKAAPAAARKKSSVASKKAPSTTPDVVEEPVLPPPPSGMTFHFQANRQGRVQSVPHDPSSTGATTTAHGNPQPTTPPFDFGADCTLPAQGPIWSFRLQTTALAEKLVQAVTSQNTGAPNPIIDCLTRMIRGALIDKDVYRTTASRASLTTEAIWLAVALIVISTVGLGVGNLFGYASHFLVKAMVLRAVGWVGAVFAVHFVAKAWQKIDLPPLAWFRAMVYAQSALLLSIVPVLGIMVTLWVAVCTVAALQDVSGKDLTTGIVLLVTAGVANGIVASVIGSFWI